MFLSDDVFLQLINVFTLLTSLLRGSQWYVKPNSNCLNAFHTVCKLLSKVTWGCNISNQQLLSNMQLIISLKPNHLITNLNKNMYLIACISWVCYLMDKDSAHGNYFFPLDVWNHLTIPIFFNNFVISKFLEILRNSFWIEMCLLDCHWCLNNKDKKLCCLFVFSWLRSCHAGCQQSSQKWCRAETHQDPCAAWTLAFELLPRPHRVPSSTWKSPAVATWCRKQPCISLQFTFSYGS